VGRAPRVESIRTAKGIRRRLPAACEQVEERPGIEDVRCARAAAPGGMDSVLHISKSTNGMGVSRADDGHARRDGEAHMFARKIQPIRKAVDLERNARLQRYFDRALEVEGILWPMPDQAPGGVTEAAHRRMAHSFEHTRRHFG